MPQPTRKTPHRIATMLEMHRRGASAREIGEAVGVSHVGIARWLKEAGLAANGGQGTRKGRARHEPAGAAEVIAGAEQALAELEIGPPPKDRIGAIDYLRTRLEQVSAMAQTLGAGATSGTTAMADFERAIKLEQSLAGQIAQLSPREPTDPEHDPNNVEAAADVRREIENAAEAIERSCVCAHCGKNPFHKGAA